MLLLNNTRAHWQMVAQLLQQTSNPMAPPDYQEYLLNVIISSNTLMKKIARDFGVQDPTEILPEPLGVEDKAGQINQQFRQQKMQQAMAQLMQGQMPGAQMGQPPNISLPQQQAPGAPGMGTGEPTVTQ